MVFKCKMCGGDIVPIKGTNTGKCEYCKSVMTLPNLDDEKIVNLYNRANFLRISNDFDKAKEVYESILSIDNNQIEAHWGLLLCKYGVEYVDDPNTKKKVPTCHRTIDSSILNDKDFKIIKKESYGDALDLYIKEAEVIDKIQKNILTISLKEKPYDVFICYKESDDNNERTHDSVIAQDIYDKLVEQGFKVFFARITLEDKLGVEYEPYIYSALKSSKVMLVVGTKEEYFNAVWVKNEWSRYLEMMKHDKGKSLIPVFSKIDPYKLPEEFAMLQAQSMDKVGALQDLVRGVKKLVNEYKQDGVSDYDQETIAKVASALDDARSIGNGKFEVTIVKETLPLWYYIGIILVAGLLFTYYTGSILGIRLRFLNSDFSARFINISKFAFALNIMSFLTYIVGLLSCVVKRKFIKFKKLLLLSSAALYAISYIICIGKGYLPRPLVLFPLFPLIVIYFYNPSWKLNTSNKTIMDKDEKDKQIAKNKMIKELFSIKEKGRLKFYILLIPIIFVMFFGLVAFYKISPMFSSSNNVNDDTDYILINTRKFIYSSPSSDVLNGYVSKNDTYKMIDIKNYDGIDFIKIKTNKGVSGWIRCPSSYSLLNSKNKNIVDDELKENIEVSIKCNIKDGLCEKYYFLSNERDKSKEQLKVITEYINIREKANASSEIIGQVHKDDIYTILRKDNGWGSYSWYQIRIANGKTGWIAGHYGNDKYVELLEME